MSDKNVDKWKQKGNLYLWKYLQNTRNYDGWNITCGDAFRDSFLELIHEISDSQYNCRKVLNLTFPTTEILKIPNNQGGQAKWKSAQTLIFKYQKIEIGNEIFSFDESENSITLLVGLQKLKILKDCFLKIHKEIDYSIEIGRTQLWVW